MESLHNTVGLGSVYLRGAVVDFLELEEQLVGISVESTTELSTVVREHDVDTPALGLEGG